MSAAALFGACSDGTGPEAERRALGILQLDTSAPTATASADPHGPISWTVPPAVGFTYPSTVIEAPDTVRLDQSFEVKVWTVGPNGCWSVADMVVAKSARVVELTPWDRQSGADVCTQVLVFLGHSTNIRLDEAGVWRLRVSGRIVRGFGHPDQPVTAERLVYVRPAS
jgi:hypothetical protein